MNNRRKVRFITFLLTVFVFTGTISGVTFFLKNHFSKAITETAVNFLAEYSKLYTKIINNELDKDSDFLKNRKLTTDLLPVEFYNSDGFLLIINKDGDLIASTENKKELFNQRNLLKFLLDNNDISKGQLAQIKTDFHEKKSGSFSIKTGNVKRLCYFNILDNKNILLTIIPYSYIQNQLNQISYTIGILVFILTVIFIFVFIIFYNLTQEAHTAQKNNEMFAKASEQNKSLIFEILFEDNQIDFTGHTKEIFGKKVSSMPLDKFRQFYSLIHEDDSVVINHIRNFFETNNLDFVSELRIKINENYEWFRLSGTLIKKNNVPYKFFGSILNVNSQIIEEQKLKQIAQTDSLSGLLNKGFMAQKTQKYIESLSVPAFCAFFIIDVDNFKTINDTLGHSMGDMVIRDTGKKLSLIFSDKDFIGRIGGDEFCIFLCLKSEINREKALGIIEEKAATICQIINEEYFNEYNSVSISSSIGIAILGEHGKNYDELYQNADKALYYVKHNGKNNYKIYTDELKDQKQESIYNSSGQTIEAINALDDFEDFEEIELIED